MNLGIGGDCVENVLWQAISLPLTSSVQNIVVQCRTNNLSTDSPRDIFICGLILRDEYCSVNRLLINIVSYILKYGCHKNGFAFIVQDHGWTLPSRSLDCSLSYKDSLHLVERGNVKLAKFRVNFNCAEQSNKFLVQ